MRRSWCSGVVGLALALAGWGCGGTAATTDAREPQPAASAKAPAVAETLQDRLLAAMHRVERPDDVFAGIPVAMREDIDGFLEHMDPRARVELVKLDGPAVRWHALLHVAAGGESVAALQVLATGASAEQLLVVHLARTNGRSTLQDVVRATPLVARAAAARFVHEGVIGVAGSGTYTAGLCELIAQAALTLERPELRLLALQAAADLKPTAPRHLAVADEAARQLDLDLAESARAGAGELSPDPAARARAEHEAGVHRVVQSARAVTERAGQALDPTTRLDHAADLLMLGRFAQARRVLEPSRASASGHLRTAALLALADLGGSVCPGMPPGTDHPMVCAAAWDQDRQVGPALQQLEQAWQSGNGRDDESLETYLGLVHVMPWMHRMASQQAEGTESFRARLRALQQTARAAAATSPRLGGLALFIDALVASVEASGQRQPGERLRLPDAVLDRLWERATALPLGAADGESAKFVHAGLLAVAAYAMQERDVLELLDRAVPDALPAPGYRRTRALLRMWCAIARERADAAEQARQELFGLLSRSGDGGFDRARSVLTLAELDVAMAGDPGAIGVLERVARSLITEDVPPDLRLRASVDLAGALSRTGRVGEAVEVLAPVAGEAQIPGPSSSRRDLLIVARSYRLVLQARSGRAGQRQPYLDQLRELDEATRSGGVPASIELWRQMWLKEIGYLIAADRCAGARGCLRRAARGRGVTPAQIDRAVGREAGRIIRRGVLSAGTVAASFEFSGSSGLWPVISLQPRFLAVEFPPAG